MAPDLSTWDDEQLLLEAARNILVVMRSLRLDNLQSPNVAMVARCLRILLDRLADDEPEPHRLDAPN